MEIDEVVANEAAAVDGDGGDIVGAVYELTEYGGRTDGQELADAKVAAVVTQVLSLGELVVRVASEQGLYLPRRINCFPPELRKLWKQENW